MSFKERQRQPGLLFLFCSWIVTGFMILTMVQPALAHYCPDCHHDPCQCTDSRRTTRLLSDLHETLASLSNPLDSDSDSSESDDSTLPSLATGSDWSMVQPIHTGSSRTVQGLVSLASGLSSMEGGIPLRLQSFSLPTGEAGPFPSRATVSHSLMEEERTTGSPRLLSPRERSQIIQQLRGLSVRIQALEQKRNSSVSTRNKAMANNQYQLLSAQDWNELNISMEDFTTHIDALKDQEMEDDVFVKLVDEKILEKAASQACSKCDEEQEGPQTTEKPDSSEVELSQSCNEFFSLLNQLLGSLSVQHGVTMITGNWNPYALSTFEPIPLMQLVRYFLRDYEYQERNSSVPICRGESLDKFKSLSAPLTEVNVYYRADPTSGQIASPGFLDLLGHALLTLNQYHVLSLIHLNTASGQDHDTIVLLSDGTNLWFGSQHLGGYYSRSMINTVNFLSAALRLLNTLFNIDHFTINTRYR